MNPPVVVDTNILFAALVSRRSRVREVLVMEPSISFSCPRFVFTELFKHKERILAATELSKEELLDTLNSLFAHIHFADESAIPIGDWLEARRLCAGVDEKDAPFIAMVIHLNARLWTEDDELKKGLREKGFDLFFEP
ncbi:MAG TPA: PIN domain-containing protein [Candidatus Saccharimonadales bacterium]|nr:PIN domain-containing protein [Candidatus Saccharimonadales bacterium]